MSEQVHFTLYGFCSVFGSSRPFLPPLVNLLIGISMMYNTFYLLAERAIHFCLSQESMHGLRLAVHLILSGKEDHFVSVWACVCGSWVSINQFTSGRSLLLPEGNVNRRYVEVANSMVSRCLLFACDRIYAFRFAEKDNTTYRHWGIKCVFLTLCRVWFWTLVETNPSSQVCLAAGPCHSTWWKLASGTAKKQC